MKKKIYNIILFAAVGICSASCDEFLDEPPKGVVVPSTVEDYDKMMNDVVTLQVGDYLDYADPDNGVTFDRLNSPGQAQKRAYGWVDFISSEEGNDDSWNRLYKSLYIANEVINNVDGASTKTESLRDIVKADALAERAACYFMLVNMYAKHYDPATADTDLGVPLLVKNDLAQQIPRATVQEVYDFVIEDLEEALAKVRTNFFPDKRRATQAGINGLLARAYLYMGDFEKAKTYADASFTKKGELVDFNEYEIDNYRDGDRIYSRNYTGNPQILWFKGGVGNDYGIDLYYSTELTALFDKDADLRWKYYAVDSIPYESKLPDGMYGYNLDITEKDHDRTVLISTPEMLLTRAEGKVRTGDKAGAIEDLNILRAVRYEEGTPDLDPVDFTDDEALQEVLDERRRELAFTTLNWYDLKRYQVEGRPVSTYTRNYDEGDGEITVTLAPGSPRYVLAIPPNLFKYNPKLIQNAR